MRTHAFARPLLAAALISAALFAQLAMLSAGDRPSGAVTMTAAAGSDDSSQIARVSMARKFPVGSRVFKRAGTIAMQHWGGLPCAGQLKIRWKKMPLHLNAVATWKDPGAAGDPRRFFGCKIALNSRINYDFARLCTSLGHEMGHLFGRDHVRRDGQFMSETYRRPAAPCRAA